MSLELLGLGLNFAGGLLGQRSSSKRQREQLQQAQHQFDQQMDHSVRRRVEDAKRAGVHPLFALGSTVGSSPTISASGERGNPMQTALTAMAKQLGMIEMNRASAARDEAEAALLDSERKRIEQELTTSRGQDAEAISEIEVKPAKRGSVMGLADYVRPQVSQSQRTGVAAGTHPSSVEYITPSGDKYTLPSTDLNMDEIAQVKYVLNEVHRYGRITRRKIEQVIQDVKQRRREWRRSSGQRGRGRYK